MALTDLQKSFIATYSLQLMQQDMLTNSLFVGGPFGAALRSMVLPTAKVTTYSDPTAQALNSRLRADSRALEQASRNVGEAASIFEILSPRTQSVVDTMDEMLAVIEKFQDGTLSQSEAESQYDTLYDSLQSLYDDVEWEGLELMNGQGWDTDERIEPNATPDPDSGRIYIHTSTSGAGGFHITIYNLEKALKDADYDPASNVFNNAPSAQAAEDALTTARAKAASFQELYAGRAANLAHQRDTLLDQAAILEQAAANRSARVATSEDVFLDYILGKFGSLIDENA